MECFGIFWAGRPGQDTKSRIDPWLEDCCKTSQELVIEDLHCIEDTYRNFVDIDKMTEQLDLRDIVKKKAEKHSRYYRSLYMRSCNGSSIESEMAQCTLDKDTEAFQTTPDGEKENKQSKQRRRRTGVYEMTDYGRETNFKSVKVMCENYQAMVEQTSEHLKKIKLDICRSETYLLPPVSGYCSSSASAGSDDEKERNWFTSIGHHSKVHRCGSSDSAVGLTQSDDELSNLNAEIADINSRWADVCEKNDSAITCGQQNSPYSPRGSIDHVNVPTKTLLEAQYFTLPLNRKLSDCPSDIECNKSDSRRQSCFTDDGDEQTRYRFWRTPSVVVSDYSDDVIGFTLEDIEYLRNQRKENSSPESSLHSSCSNLNYCGSCISSLDTEYILRKPFRKGSDCSTCSTLSGDEGEVEEKQFQTLDKDKIKEVNEEMDTFAYKFRLRKRFDSKF